MVELKDISFSVLILVITASLYYVYQDLAVAFFCLIFLGMSYLEAETVSVVMSIKKGGLKLRKDRIPLLREYNDVMKRWAPITLTLAFGLTSFVLAMRETPFIRYFVLLTLFIYAMSAMVFSFTIFTSELVEEKAVGNQVMLNSFFMWLLTAITAVVSGYVAAFFGISPFEDVAAAILPLFIAELIRLKFMREAVFSLRFSEIEQASKFLSLAEMQYAPSDPFLTKLKSTHKRMDEFLERSIALEHEQSQIISNLRSRKHDLTIQVKNHNKSSPFQPSIVDLQVLRKEKENSETYGPFYFDGGGFYSVIYQLEGALTGFSVFEVASRSFISDREIAKKIAECNIIFWKMSDHSTSKMKTKLRTYIGRSRLLLSDALHDSFKRSLIRNTSQWISKFDDFERAKHEGLIGLDMTAFLDHFVAPTIIFVELALAEFDQAFSHFHSYQIASSIIEWKTRLLALYQERLKIWEQRAEAAKIIPARVAGSTYVQRSSETIKETIVSEHQELQIWINSLKDETQSLLDKLRT